MADPPPNDVGIKSPARPPLAADAHEVIILHPGYPGEQVLLLLHAPDAGLHYTTALVACQIVADNRWDGFLSETRDGCAMATPSDGLLRGTKYYFHVPDATDNPYPIVPRFDDWRFPHEDLPPSWSDLDVGLNTPERGPLSNVAGAVLQRDITCRVTDRSCSAEIAHLVPVSEGSWFVRNQMFRGVKNSSRLRGLTALNEPVNRILLRKDIHYHFDKCFIVPAPRLHEGRRILVTHVLDSSAELIADFHNQPLQPLRGIPVPYLFARFAWAIFPSVQGFVCSSKERWLTVRTGADTFESKAFSGEQCDKLLAPKPRSTTGTKRKESTSDTPESGITDDDGVIDNSSSTERATKRRRLGPSASTRPSTPTNSPPLSPHSSALEEFVRQSLEAERQKSDPEGKWLEELEWAQEAGERTMSQREVIRYYRAMGYDVLTDEGEHLLG